MKGGPKILTYGIQPTSPNLDYKNRMILFFILIAIIPIAALSAVFTTTVIKFKEEISPIY
jgi:hypothetical protein